MTSASLQCSGCCSAGTGCQYVLYGAIAGHLLALAIAVATCVHRRQLYVRYSFGPPLIAGTLAVVLFQA